MREQKHILDEFRDFYIEKKIQEENVFVVIENKFSSQKSCIRLFFYP